MDNNPPIWLVTGTKPVTALQVRQKLLNIAPAIIDRIYGITTGVEDDTHLKPLQTLFTAITRLQIIDDPVSVVTSKHQTAAQHVDVLMAKVAAGEMSVSQAEKLVDMRANQMELSEAEKLRDYFRQQEAESA